MCFGCWSADKTSEHVGCLKQEQANTFHARKLFSIQDTQVKHCLSRHGEAKTVQRTQRADHGPNLTLEQTQLVETCEFELFLDFHLEKQEFIVFSK